MQCDRCQTVIEPEEEKSHQGRVLCEDCYLEEVSRVKVCDPWAVYCATSTERHGGPATFTPIQSEILRVLQKQESLEPAELLQALGGKLTMPQLEQEFAALRHLEKVRGEKVGAKVVIRLW